MISKIFRPHNTFLAIVLFIFSSQVHSVESNSIDDFIKLTYPNKEVKVISGKLGPSAEEYYVLCLSWHDEENAPMEDYGKIVIIKKSPEGNLHIIIQSPTYQMYLTTKNDIAIKNGILKYTYGYSSGCCSGTYYEHKFRRDRQGKFPRIGTEEINEKIDITGDGDPKITKSGVSTNYNTQKAITWTIENGKRKETVSYSKDIKIITLDEFTNG